MTHTRKVLRAVALVGVVALLGASSSDDVVRAQSQAFGLPGTWFISVPVGGAGSGLVGFYTYDHSGTMTGVVSNLYGGLPRPGGVTRLSSTDRGEWRPVPGGFEIIIFRMAFEPNTREMVGIVRIRGLVSIDGDGHHTSGTFFITQWFCPTSTTCPDPTRDPPDVPEFAPPANTWTQSRVRFP